MAGSRETIGRHNLSGIGVSPSRVGQAGKTPLSLLGQASGNAYVLQPAMV
jgi:hypothetical protein